MTIPMRQQSAPTPATIEDVLVKGDLSKLTEHQRTDYYLNLCKSIGLNPLTQPFEYLTLNGKLVLYAKRACADQLRKINGISLHIVSQEQADGLLTIHVKAKDSTGREDEDLGVVSFPEGLKGDARANTVLKAVTKAKRRVTLSISGLGFLDETEVADLPETAKRPVAPPVTIEQPKTLAPPHDPQTGEIGPHKIEYDTWVTFGQKMIAATKDQPETVKDAWMFANADTVKVMKKDAPKVHKRMMAAMGIKEPSDPEAYLKDLTKQCAALKSAAALEELEVQQVETFAQMFPPDVGVAKKIIADRIAELNDA